MALAKNQNLSYPCHPGQPGSTRSHSACRRELGEVAFIPVSLPPWAFCFSGTGRIASLFCGDICVLLVASMAPPDRYLMAAVPPGASQPPAHRSHYLLLQTSA